MTVLPHPKTFAIAATVLFTGACGPSAEARAALSAEHHEAGLLSLGNGDATAAIGHFEAALEMVPDDAVVLNDLGRALYANREYEAAVERHTRASETDPSNTEYLFRRGIALIELNRFPEARDAFAAVLELDPEHRDAWNDLGFVYNRMGDYETAIEHFDRTIELDPDIPNPHAHRGYALLRLGRTGEASDALEVAQGKDARYNKTYFYWACFFSWSGNRELAIQQIRMAVDRGFEWADWMATEPTLDPIRTDERFLAALESAQALQRTP